MSRRRKNRVRGRAGYERVARELEAINRLAPGPIVDVFIYATRLPNDDRRERWRGKDWSSFRKRARVCARLMDRHEPLIPNPQIGAALVP